jgi:hypothetical protein
MLETLEPQGFILGVCQDCCSKRRDWFFDWSLKGAVVKPQKNSLIQRIKKFFTKVCRRTIGHPAPRKCPLKKFLPPDKSSFNFSVKG